MNKYYILMPAVLVLIIAGYFFYSSNSVDEWIININSLSGSAEADCLYGENYSFYSPYNSLEEVSEAADYILTVKVLDLEEKRINDDLGRRDLSFEIINWEKGDLGYVPKKLKISSDYNPGLYHVEGDTTFGDFRTGNSYRIYLKNIDGGFSFINADKACVFNGIEKL